MLKKTSKSLQIWIWMHSQKEKDVVYSHVTLASDDGKLTGEIQEIKKKMTFLENSVKQNDQKHLDLRALNH